MRGWKLIAVLVVAVAAFALGRISGRDAMPEARDAGSAARDAAPAARDAVPALGDAAPAQADEAPVCRSCGSDYVPADEIEAYEQVAAATGLTDQQVRSIDVGNANVQIALAHRSRLEAPAPQSVAVHDLVTEVYVVLSGSGTNVTSSELVDAVRRPDDNRAVRFLNGPGRNAAAMRNAVTNELGPGDVLVIPAGTGHQFTRIDDHITYLMVRVDPEKVVPLMGAADSRAYLDENLPRDEDR